MMRRVALALFVALELSLMVTVQSCGHHVVHSQLKALVDRHMAHQTQMSSARWGPKHGAGGRQIGDSHMGDGLMLSLDEDEMEEQAHGRRHGHGHVHPDDEAEGSSGDGQSGALVTEQASGPDGFMEDTDGFMEDTDESMVAGLKARERNLQQATPAPIRLSVTYQMLGALDASQQQTLTRVVEAVRRILQKFISVKLPSVGGMLADPYCNLNSWSCYPDFNSRARNPDRECGLATILPQHIVNPFNCTSSTTRAYREALGRGASGPASGIGRGASGYGFGCSSYAGTKGEETDMYLYITAVQNDDCVAGAAAWARPCLLDLGNNRPLVGAANVCPRALDLLDEKALTAVLTHEMIHALGFTDTMYNLTRRADGTPRPVGELVKSGTVSGKKVQLLVSPNVRAAAQAQFGCPSLAGAQLEEEGSAGSAGSHWEYTHYQGEVMVASTLFAADGTPPALSNLTLAYLDDTGWYVANRSVAGLLSWSAGAGCQLPTLSCSEYMASVPSQRLFCDAKVAAQRSSNPTFMCSKNYKATGVCRALNFTSGCGLVLSRTSSETCLGPDAANDLPEVFGWGTGSPSGRCLPVKYRFHAFGNGNQYIYPAQGLEGDTDAACFETVCSADGSTVSVKILGHTFECLENKELVLPQLLSSHYLSGRIGPCPRASDLCATQTCSASACNVEGGDCLNGVCYCHLSYSGADCSFNLITGQPAANSAGTGSTSSPSQGPKWTEVVQLTLGLNNSVASVKSRLQGLKVALASWAGLNASAVVIQNVAAGSGGGVGSGGAGDSYDAFANATADGRRRGLQQASSPPPQASVAAAAVATAWLTPNVDRPAATLLAWLKDSTKQATLIADMRAAGFYVVAGGISSKSVLMQSAVSPPAWPVVTTSSPAGDGHSSRGRTVIIIALAVGAVAVAGVIAAVVTAVVLRTRRQRRANTQGRANVYQLPPNPLAGYGAPQPPPSGFGTGGGFPPAGRDLHGSGATSAPSANPFATSGAGAWHGARYNSPEMAAYSYYSARGASQGPPPPQPYQPEAPGQLSPIYSGPQNQSYI